MKHYRSKEAGIAHAAILVVAVLVVVGATGAYVMTHHKKQLNESSAHTTTSLPTSLSNIKTVSDIKQLATQQDPTATVTSAEVSQQSNGTTIYEVTLSNGKKLTFNAVTGALISTEHEQVSATAELPPAQLITVDQARAAALTVHQGTIASIKVDDEEGVVSYTVRFTDGTQVDINAKTGAVIRTITNNRNDNKSSDNKPGASTSQTSSESGTSTSTENSGSESHSNGTSGSGSHSSGSSESETSGSGSGH